jgi:hypothetical protein
MARRRGDGDTRRVRVLSVSQRRVTHEGPHVVRLPQNFVSRSCDRAAVSNPWTFWRRLVVDGEQNGDDDDVIFLYLGLCLIT